MGYEDDFTKINMLQAQKLVEEGLSDKFIARFFCVSLRAWNYWKKSNAKFGEMYASWKDVADSKVVKALYKRATGYTHIEEEKNDDGIVINKKKTYYPPSDAAIKLWLTNRLPEEWKDKKEVASENKTQVEGKIVVDERDVKERLIAYLQEDDITNALQ